MTLEEIKIYLKYPRVEFNSSITDDLKELKKEAILKGNETLANEIWYVQQIYDIQKKYVSAFDEMKHKKYFNAWLLFDSINNNLFFIRENFGHLKNDYNLVFISSIIKQYEKVFPNYLYTSRENLIKSQKCSICGKKISLRNGCNHIPGKLYMGELCCKVVTDMEFLGMAIVKKPFDKYAVMHIEGEEYDYSQLEKLINNLDSPYRMWYVETTERINPLYNNTGRNDKCPCGSGKKYKRCCMNTDRILEIHNKITIFNTNYPTCKIP